MKKPIYKKWWFWVSIVLLIVLVILVPFLINESYKTTLIPESSKYITEWSAADVLAYYGAALSFLGTVVLGALAFWQNEKAQETNNRLLELEKKSKRGYFVPEHKVKADGFPKPITRDHFIEDPGIALLCCGDDNVYVSKSVYSLNSRTVEDNNGIFVTAGGDFSTILIPVALTEDKKTLAKLNIEIVLHLENSRMYRYTQTLYLTFEKREEKAYRLCSFNSRFSDKD